MLALLSCYCFCCYFSRQSLVLVLLLSVLDGIKKTSISRKSFLSAGNWQKWYMFDYIVICIFCVFNPHPPPTPKLLFLIKRTQFKALFNFVLEYLCTLWRGEFDFEVVCINFCRVS